MTKFTHLFQLLSLFLFLFLFASCGSTKRVHYFQDIHEIPEIVYQYDQAHNEVRIRPGDNLLITVNAGGTDRTAAEPYNLIDFSRSTSSSQSLELRGYIVDENGDINFVHPSIGLVHLGGLTKAEAATLLQSKLNNLIDPSVNIRILNYTISVLGEVSRPGAYTITDERISIPEAIARAGDMTIYGNRKDVMLIRMENGEKKAYSVDMTSSALFFSPEYYLQQNDILYVKQNKSKAASSAYSSMVGTVVSVATLLISITSLIIRL